MNLNAEIRAEMARQRISYADLAKALGTSRQGIWRKLSTDRPVGSLDLFAIADALNVHASELMRRAEEVSVA